MAGSARGHGGGEAGTVAVIDVGKTNVKVSAATADGRILETLSAANAVRPGPPWRHHDLAGLGEVVFGALAGLARRHPLGHVIATGHGSGGMLVTADPDAGGDGLALPMIDYEQPLPPAIGAAYAPLAGSFHDRGSAIMMASTHQARQLLWMESEAPDAVAGAAWYLGIPQYWAWRLCGRAASEASFLGAQSHLWNVPERRFTPIVRARGWTRLMPPFAHGGDDLGPVRPALARRYGLPAGLHVHVGCHDSTANAYRYRAAGRGDLMVVSTGTWIVALAGNVAPERLVEAGGMTLNADLDGEPVGGALTMGGRAFAAIAGVQPEGATADPAIVAALVARRTMALPSFGDNDGQFPGTAGKGRIAGPPAETPAERLALAVLTMALLTTACIDRLDPERPVVLDGTYLKDPLYAALVAALRPQATTLFNTESAGVQAGAALLAGHHGRTQPIRLDHSATKVTDPVGERMLQAIESGAISRRPDDPVGSESALEHSATKVTDPVGERVLQAIESGAISRRPDATVRSDSALAIERPAAFSDPGLGPYARAWRAAAEAAIPPELQRRLHT